MVHLSHVVVRALETADGIIFNQPPNEVRNCILRVFRDELRRDEAVEVRVRRKITSQKRRIPEGSPEWEILYRKYYEEEISSLGGN
ncbi:MAG: DUF507 family protein [Acidobacteriota bacterium]